MTGAPTPRLVGLVGRAGAGKDASAAVLKRLGWRGMAFADALRIEVAAAWAVDMALLCDRIGKERSTPQLSIAWCQDDGFRRYAEDGGHTQHIARSPRWAMQIWGDYRRGQCADYFVRQVALWVSYQRRCGHHGLVITDVRFANEAAMVVDFGGALLRVHRPDLPAMDNASHASEQVHAITTSADIHNDGTLDHLHAEVLRVLASLEATA